MKLRRLALVYMPLVIVTLSIYGAMKGGSADKEPIYGFSALRSDNELILDSLLLKPHLDLPYLKGTYFRLADTNASSSSYKSRHLPALVAIDKASMMLQAFEAAANIACKFPSEEHLTESGHLIYIESTKSQRWRADRKNVSSYALTVCPSISEFCEHNDTFYRKMKLKLFNRDVIVESNKKDVLFMKTVNFGLEIADGVVWYGTLPFDYRDDRIELILRYAAFGLTKIALNAPVIDGFSDTTNLLCDGRRQRWN